MKNGRMIMKGRLRILLFCAVLLLLSIPNFVPKQNFSSDSIVILEPFDKIVFHRNETGRFEVPLPGMVKGQYIHAYLSVREGTIAIKCLDGKNKKELLSERMDTSGIRFSIPNDGDYLLTLDAVDADFAFALTILNSSRD